MRNFCKACALLMVVGCGYSQVNPRGVQEVGGVAHDGTRAVVDVLSGGGSSAKGALLDSAVAAPIGIIIGAASVVAPGPRPTGPSGSQASAQISENEDQIRDNEALLREQRERVERSSRSLSNLPTRSR